MELDKGHRGSGFRLAGVKLSRRGSNPRSVPQDQKAKSRSLGWRVRTCICRNQEEGEESRGAGPVEVKGEKSEVGGPRAQVSWHWHWGRRAYLGSHWARESTFTLMEQNGSELSLVPDPSVP